MLNATYQGLCKLSEVYFVFVAIRFYFVLTPNFIVWEIKKIHLNLYFFLTLFSLPPVFNTKIVAYLLPGPLPPDPTFLLEERLFPRTRDSSPLKKRSLAQWYVVKSPSKLPVLGQAVPPAL